jgi:hypothetical protein
MEGGLVWRPEPMAKSSAHSPESSLIVNFLVRPVQFVFRKVMFICDSEPTARKRLGIEVELRR